MSKTKEIRNTLKAEIILAARRLIKHADDIPFEQLAAEFGDLCRKMAAWEYLHRTGDTDILAPSDPEEKEPEIPAQPEPQPEQPSATAHTADRPSFIDKHKDYLHKSMQAGFKPKGAGGSRPNPLVPRLRLGLADKMALLNNLFGGDAALYAEFVEKVDAAPDFDSALRVVSRYKDLLDWKGKDEYEFRLLQLIQAKFQ